MSYAVCNDSTIINYWIFLVQTYQHQLAYQRLYWQYDRLINRTIWKFQHQFPYLPFAFAICRLNAHCLMFELLLQFRFDHRLPFINFFLPRLRWKLLKQVRCLLEKHQSLIIPVYDQTHLLNHPATHSITLVNCVQPTKAPLIQELLTKLTPLERIVCQMRLKGFRNRQIVQQSGLAYRQVDNAWERIKKKSKRYIMNYKIRNFYRN